MPKSEVKVRITRVYPLNATECMFHVSVGLTEFAVFAAPKSFGTLGQELELSGLRPYLDMDGKCQTMISELYKWGRSETTEVDGEGTPWRVPTNYQLLDNAPPDRALFLEEIWRLMRATGMMDVTERDQHYLADHSEAYDYLALGYRIAEYQWKFSHEEAASAGYRVRSERQEGQRIAAQNRVTEGKVKDDRLLKLARSLIQENPELARNDAALARRVVEHPNRPEGVGQPGIRKRLGRLRRDGNL